MNEDNSPTFGAFMLYILLIVAAVLSICYFGLKADNASESRKRNFELAKECIKLPPNEICNKIIEQYKKDNQ